MGCAGGDGTVSSTQPRMVYRSAELSACGRYRYTLVRCWDDALPRALWLMLNPSIADAMVADATIRRCVGFAQRWGCGSIAVGNLYGLRATHPSELKRCLDPVGFGNDRWLAELLQAHRPSAPLVCAWGTLARKQVPRAREVLAEVQAHGHTPQCLGRTVGGHPMHPVRLPYACELEAFGGYPT